MIFDCMQPPHSEHGELGSRIGTRFATANPSYKVWERCTFGNIDAQPGYQNLLDFNRWILLENVATVISETVRQKRQFSSLTSRYVPCSNKSDPCKVMLKLTSRNRAAAIAIHEPKYPWCA